MLNLHLLYIPGIIKYNKKPKVFQFCVLRPVLVFQWKGCVFLCIIFEETAQEVPKNVASSVRHFILSYHLELGTGMAIEGCHPGASFPSWKGPGEAGMQLGGQVWPLRRYLPQLSLGFLTLVFP